MNASKPEKDLVQAHFGLPALKNRSHLWFNIGGHLAESQIRILLVDDFYPFRRYISSTLRKRADVRLIGEAADGIDAVNQAKQLRPDLILLDIGLPGQNGIDAAREIRTACPESKIVFLTQESSVELVEEALALGAKGYIVKSAVATELMTALDVVIGGDCFVGRGCGQRNSGKSADTDGHTDSKACCASSFLSENSARGTPMRLQFSLPGTLKT